MTLKNIFKKYQKLFFYVSIFILIFIAFLLRIKPALIRPITFDEVFTLLYLVDKPDIHSLILADASVPPLHYLLIKFIANFSMNVIYPRMISILFSILTLAIVVVWLRKISKLLTILVVFFLTFSAFQLFYASWEAYVYPQLFLLGTISLYSLYKSLYDENISENKLKIYLIIYVMSSLAAFFTHYAFIWTLLAEFAIIFGEFFCTKKARKKFNFLIIKFLLVLIVPLFFYLPIFFSLFSPSLNNLLWMEKPTIFSFGYMSKTLFGLLDFTLNDSLINNGTVLASIFILLFIFACIYFSLSNKNKIFNETEKKLILYNFIVFIFNLFIPLFFSFFLKSSIYGARTLVIASLSLTILISVFLLKLIRLNILTAFFVVLFCLFVFFKNAELNQTQLVTTHRGDVSKNYVNFFRKNLNPEDSNFNNNFVFLDFSNQDHIAKNYIDTVRRNLTFDYYWFGYDGQKPLPKYNLINSSNFEAYKRDPFWGIVLVGDPLTMDANIPIVCGNVTERYGFYGWEPTYIFKCN